jgi:hypothetical protein
MIRLIRIIEEPERAPVHAQTPVERVSTKLATTQRELQTATTTTTAQAAVLQQGLSSSEPGRALPKELQDFNTSTKRLCTLRENLTKDITEYENASQAQLALFDQERAAITDPTMSRSMGTLRRHPAQIASHTASTHTRTLNPATTEANLNITRTQTIRILSRKTRENTDNQDILAHNTLPPCVLASRSPS